MMNRYVFSYLRKQFSFYLLSLSMLVSFHISECFVETYLAYFSMVVKVRLIRKSSRIDQETEYLYILCLLYVSIQVWTPLLHSYYVNGIWFFEQ